MPSTTAPAGTAPCDLANAVTVSGAIPTTHNVRLHEGFRCFVASAPARTRFILRPNDAISARGRSPDSYSRTRLNTKADRNPITVINPVKSWASSKASGIMVSTSMVRIAPAANAVTAAIHSGAKRLTIT
jgi:hypothetical protein